MAKIEFVRKLILKREGDDYFFNQGVMVFFTTEARGNFHHRGTESTEDRVFFTTETRSYFFYHRGHRGARSFFINLDLISEN